MPNYHIYYRLFAFFLKCEEEFQIDLGMLNLVISITLENKAPKVSQIIGLFMEKLDTFKTF